MRIASTRLMVVLLLAGAMAAQTHGLKPRARASDYPAHQGRNAVTIGAEQLSRAQVQHAFATELDRRYVVVEVGAFPKGAVLIAPQDFVLRVVGTNQLIRHASPQTIAEVLHKNPPSSRDVTVYPTVGVGYSTAGRDPWGNGGGGGWTTSAGVGVGIGSTQKGGTDADKPVMETELREKSLPAGETDKPVAGYLYFPVSTTKKVMYELQYSADGQAVVRILLKAPVE